jgi:hypothetical protein
MAESDPTALQRNVQESSTEDLLDRITAFRAGMEPYAIPIIEAELNRRGVHPQDIKRHETEKCSEILLRPEGFAFKCSYCRKPAVERRWGWHWIWDLIPFLPCMNYYCIQHAQGLEPESKPENPI